MILMPQIFDVTANENARYKRNELEFIITYFTTKKKHPEDISYISISKFREKILVNSKSFNFLISQNRFLPKKNPKQNKTKRKQKTKQTTPPPQIWLILWLRRWQNC